MLEWKEHEYMNGQATYRLELDGHEVLYIDFRPKEEVPYTFTSFWGSSAYINDPIDAKTAQDAKRKALQWLAKEYERRIESMKRTIIEFENAAREAEKLLEAIHDE